jgi:hypothetical protein
MKIKYLKYKLLKWSNKRLKKLENILEWYF